jgi:hypothetical protein
MADAENPTELIAEMGRRGRAAALVLATMAPNRKAAALVLAAEAIRGARHILGVAGDPCRQRRGYGARRRVGAVGCDARSVEVG